MKEDVLRNNLMSLRKNKGLTQKELAISLNYSDKVISKWERGESVPNVEALEQIAHFYNCSIDDLINENLDSDEETITSSALKVVKVSGTSKLFNLSIFIPLAIWIIATFYGPRYFVVFGFGFLIYWIYYGLKISKVSFHSQYEGHDIKIVNKPSKIEFFIDEKLVDGNYSWFAFHLKLTGKINQKTIKANVSNNLFVKCEIFVE